jgi:hypothetical protein
MLSGLALWPPLVVLLKIYRFEVSRDMPPHPSSAGLEPHHSRPAAACSLQLLSPPTTAATPTFEMFFSPPAPAQTNKSGMGDRSSVLGNQSL